MKNVLQSVGVVALVAWTVVGGIAWSKVKGHFEVRIQETATGGDDELALLDDRLQTLSGDLDALVGSIGENFGLLADVVQDQKGAEGIELARLQERIRSLESALPSALEAREVSGTLSAVLARLEAIQASPAGFSATPTMAIAGGQPSSVGGETPTGNHADREPEPELPEPAGLSVAPAIEPEGSAPEPSRSFLAFKLPSREFQFEGIQTFELLEDLSRVGFDAKSTLHDFTGVSNRVRGSLRLDLSRPELGIEGRVEVDSKSLDTGLEGRDEAMLEHLDAGEFDALRFEPASFEPGDLDSEARRVSGTVKGRMTIRGVTHEVSMEVKAEVDESRRLVIQGEMPLLLSDYAVPVPSKLGVISMEDEVRVWIHLRARAKAEASR